MSELILYYYVGLFFFEKVWLVLGFKGLFWCSVDVLVICFKFDVVVLIGGYWCMFFL